MIGIYKITNQCNGKIYIGQSKDIEERWKEHKRKMQVRNTQLYQAMRLFGVENFNFEVIEECSLDQLNEKEKFYIHKYDSLNNGYNMSIIENKQHKINWEVVNQIIKDLKETDLKGEDIAEKYQVSDCLISQINHGKMWHINEQVYPIRQKEKKNKQSQKWHCPLSRKELKDLIRTFPFTKIGNDFGVSDNTIRKWCDKYSLPRTKKEIKSYSDEEWNLI